MRIITKDIQLTIDGKVVFDRKMEAYEPFRLDITYRNNRAP